MEKSTRMNSMKVRNELERWLLRPTPYASVSSLIGNQDLYSNVKWKTTFIKRDSPFIAQSLSGVQDCAFMASRRLLIFNSLNQLYPNTPMLLLLKSECHLMLNDAYGALICAKDAAKLLTEYDNVLQRTIQFLEMTVEIDSQEEDSYSDNEESITIHPYTRPPDFIRTFPAINLIGLQEKWLELQRQHDGAEQFCRYALVESNELEEVFQLDDESTLKLARCGFYANSIEGISPISKQKNPKKIISILEQTQQCFHSVRQGFISDNSKSFSEEFVQNLHSTLLQGHNIDVQIFDDDMVPHFVPIGRYRRVPCYTTHEDSEGNVREVRYCKSNMIEGEMNWYTQQFSTLLEAEDTVDPFRVCAWIQWVFTRIHPFADGNGRLSRMISSIPLLRSGLPPVYVSKESKDRYLQVLAEADRTNDVDLLATFLREEIFQGLEKILNYNRTSNDAPSTPPRKAYTFFSSSKNKPNQRRIGSMHRQNYEQLSKVTA